VPQITSTLVGVAAIAGAFLILIAPHEGGHFALAKLFKVRVIEFSIGAGTKLVSFTRGGTLYAIRLLPILGYVRMGGMEADDFSEPNGFHSKKAWQRIAILAAGPAANFMVAILLVTGYGLTQLNDDPGRVARVVPYTDATQTVRTPAAATGVKVGDHIKAVNGKPVTGPGYIQEQEKAAPGKPIVLTGYHADGKPFTYILVPVCDASNNCLVGIGVAALVSVQSAVTNGLEFPFNAIGGITQGLSALVTGKIPGGLFGPQGLTGPIGIAAITEQTVSQGPNDYVLLVAILSVALGFTNLLPVPALDGGRIVVVLIEAVRRRPFNRKSELNFQRWGLVALLGLAAIISFLDIQRIATGQFLGGH
jgi:regulator of sigma E protease